VTAPWIEVERDNGVSVVRLSGEVDVSRAPALRRSLNRAVDNRDVGLVIDLTEATYLDSAGVNILFELADAMGRRQLALALVVPDRGLVERVVSLVDLGSVTRLHRTAEAAVGEIRAAVQG
jgi:anti-anti-sigma factor